MKYPFSNFILLIFALLLTSISFSCNGDDAIVVYESKASVKGMEFLACPCCGGWIIEIENDTTSYRAAEIPDFCADPLAIDAFPLDIKMNWTVQSVCVFNTYIIVDEFECQ